ncbi:MAG: ribose 5-phosphate isomerase B [Clostridia bacterium]|nr:ribose 5-phosphate isomerase B [Clostridia bacterium]
MKIAIGCDHGGFVLKESVINFLNNAGFEVIDCGTYSDASVDYPIFGEKVARLVAKGECEKGIVMCGTGIGISIAANKVNGIRCALCHDEYTAKMTAMHNNSNVLAMGGRVVTPEMAVKIVKTWLDTPFEGGRHINRVNMFTEIENRKE